MDIKDKFKNISATVQAFSCNVLHDLEDIRDIENYIESLKCCGNCKYNIAGSLKCLKDVFSIKCFYRDGEGEKHWESDSEPLPSM